MLEHHVLSPYITLYFSSWFKFGFIQLVFLYLFIYLFIYSTA